MSMDAKLALVQDLEEAMEDDLTVSAMKKLKDALSGLLSDYDVEMHNTGEKNENDDLLTAYLDAKRVEGLAPKTLKRYEYVLGKLLESACLPLNKMQVGNLRTYLAAEKDRGISDRTLNGERSVFCSCFGWLYAEGLINRNPCGNMNKIRYAQKVRLPYSDTDIELMKEACDTLRDRTIIAFLLSTGARISEVCALNRDDIDFQNAECKVLGKGNKERKVYIDNVAGMLLRRYFLSRKDDSPALFVGRASERLEPGGVRRMLKRIEAVSGVENVHPHRFRRTLATSLIDHGMSIQEVAAILGHSNINTTMTYIYIKQENVKNNYRKYA